MGYKSRIYVVDYHQSTNWGEVLCMMNLCKIGYDGRFTGLFMRKVDYEVFIDNSHEPTTEDDYGDPIEDAPVQDVIDFIENEASKNDYRRLAPCLAMLKGFDPQQWDDLRVIHYGY